MLSNFGAPHWFVILSLVFILAGGVWLVAVHIRYRSAVKRAQEALQRSRCTENSHRTMMATHKPTTRSVAKAADDEYQRGGRKVKRTFQKKK